MTRGSAKFGYCILWFLYIYNTAYGVYNWYICTCPIKAAGELEVICMYKIKKNSFLQNYAFLIIMLFAIVAGCIVGWLFPNTGETAGASVLKPLGTLFINMMFCVVVPMVFASIAGAVANMAAASVPARSWAPPSPPLWLPAPLPRLSCSC